MRRMSAYPGFVIRSIETHFTQPKAFILDCQRILTVRPNLDLEIGLQEKIHILQYKGKGKGKVQHTTGHEGPVAEWGYSFTLS